MAPLRGKTVLIVDDEPHIRELLQFELQTFGAQVIEASNGLEAKQHLQNQAGINLIISDVRMPKMSGLELLDWSKSHHPEIPIILFSGYSEVTPDEAIKRGAANVLSKPLDWDQLLQLADRLTRHVS